MSSVAPFARREAGSGITPRRVALAAGALGLATLFGMALGSVPALTQGNSRISLSAIGNATPANANDEAALEEQARQAAIQQIARAILKKSLAEQAALQASKDHEGAAAPAAPAPAPAQAQAPAPAQSVAAAPVPVIPVPAVPVTVAPPPMVVAALPAQTATAGAAAAASLADKSEPAPDPTTSASTGGAKIATVPAPQVAATNIDPEDMQRLAGKAAEAIRSGDIASARLVLEHAVRAGDATALYALAETYDPRVLVKLRVMGMEGEPETARELYQRALDSGVEEARARL